MKFLTHRTIYLAVALALTYLLLMPFSFIVTSALFVFSVIVDLTEWKQRKKSEISVNGGLYIILSVLLGHYFFLFGPLFGIMALFNWFTDDGCAC